MPLTRLLQELAQSRGTIDWTGWLPIALEAARGDSWAEAWRSLSAEDQFAVLTRLQADGGVFADTLVMLAGREASAVPNAMVRESLLLDAADASTRLADQIEAWRVRLADQLSASRRAEAQATEEVARLEAELAELRGRNVGGDYERMIELQGQLTDLQAQSAQLEAFDRQAAEAEREGLEARIASLRSEVDALNASVDLQRAESSDLEGRARTLQQELSRVTEDRAAATTRISQDTETVAAMRADLSRLAAEAQGLDVARREHAERLAGLRRDRQLLEELENSPIANEAREIAERIDELLRSLPNDEADRQVASRTPNA